MPQIGQHGVAFHPAEKLFCYFKTYLKRHVTDRIPGGSLLFNVGCDPCQSPTAILDNH